MAEKLLDKDVHRLWLDYKKTGCIEVRNKLIENYLPLVNVIAGRIAISLPAHVDRDDLISSGFFGLLDAIERYDLDKKNKFETYAGIRIRGAILDYLRSKDWIPVSLRQKIRKYEHAVVELENMLGRSATDEEIAAKMQLTAEELHELVKQLNIATIVPLDDYIRIEAMADTENSQLLNIEAQEIQDILAKAIDDLPEKEKLVVSLYYYNELTLKEISLILNLSEARISQLHTKAIMRLRASLAPVRSSVV